MLLCLAHHIPVVEIVSWHFMVSLSMSPGYCQGGSSARLTLLSTQCQVGVIRCSLDREGEKASQVQGQHEKSSEQVRVVRGRAGDGHSKSISGAGNGGLGWAEMESWHMDREKEDTGGGWAARGNHVAAIRPVRSYNPSF